MKFHIDFTIEIQLFNKKASHRIYSKTTWQRVRKAIGDRDGYLCHYCGVYAVDGTVDHVVPVSRGGDDSYTNLVWACQPCNFSKGDKPLDEWIRTSDSGSDEPEVGIDEGDFSWFCQHIQNGNAGRMQIVHKTAPSGTVVTRGYWEKLRKKAIALDSFGSDNNGSLRPT